MTQPDAQSAAGVALQYIREELMTLRTTVHEELAAMRADISGLAGELRGYTAEQGPRLAVLEHRITEVEKDVLDVKTSKRDTWKMWSALGVSVLSAVLAWLLPLITAGK